MKLPNCERAFVDPAKLADYALDPEHEEGKRKALIFAAALGITHDDWPRLLQKLLQAARDTECV